MIGLIWIKILVEFCAYHTVKFHNSHHTFAYARPFFYLEYAWCLNRMIEKLVSHDPFLHPCTVQCTAIRNFIKPMYFQLSKYILTKKMYFLYPFPAKILNKSHLLVFMGIYLNTIIELPLLKRPLNSMVSHTIQSQKDQRLALLQNGALVIVIMVLKLGQFW